MEITLRPARRVELPALSDLCRASKAYWGYDDAFMAACYDELTVTPEDMPNVVVADTGGMAVGLAEVSSDGDVVDLEKFFVHPDQIGTGVGRILFDWVVAETKRRGVDRIEIEADPGARPFYEKMGAVVTGAAPSLSIPGRVLPKLTLMLTRDET